MGRHLLILSQNPGESGVSSPSTVGSDSCCQIPFKLAKSENFGEESQNPGETSQNLGEVAKTVESLFYPPPLPGNSRLRNLAAHLPSGVPNQGRAESSGRDRTSRPGDGGVTVEDHNRRCPR